MESKDHNQTAKTKVLAVLSILVYFNISFIKGKRIAAKFFSGNPYLRTSSIPSYQTIGKLSHTHYKHLDGFLPVRECFVIPHPGEFSPTRKGM
jgi:hypothetical protein